jgi:hypothetical protein
MERSGCRQKHEEGMQGLAGARGVPSVWALPPGEERGGAGWAVWPWGCQCSALSISMETPVVGHHDWLEPDVL